MDFMKNRGKTLAIFNGADWHNFYQRAKAYFSRTGMWSSLMDQNPNDAGPKSTKVD
jgi:hypothetical protein